MSKKLPAVRSLPVKDSLDSTWNAQRVFPKSRSCPLRECRVPMEPLTASTHPRRGSGPLPRRTQTESPAQTRHVVSKRHTRQRLNNNKSFVPRLIPKGFSTGYHWDSVMVFVDVKVGSEKEGQFSYPAVPSLSDTPPQHGPSKVCGSPGTEVRSLVCSANTCVIQQQLGRRPTAYMYMHRRLSSDVASDGVLAANPSTPLITPLSSSAATPPSESIRMRCTCIRHGHNRAPESKPLHLLG